MSLCRVIDAILFVEVETVRARVCVCVCVCVCLVCMCVCVHAGMRVYWHACVRACMRASVHVP